MFRLNPQFFFNFFPLIIFILSIDAEGQEKTITKESEVTTYDLPKNLLSKNGTKINTVEKWENIRRNEILSYFENEIYGRAPVEKIIPKVDIIENN